MLQIIAILFLFIGVSTPLSFAHDPNLYVGFCAGNSEACFTVRRESVMKYPNSFLATYLTTPVGKEIQEVNGKEYFRIHSVDTKVFNSILYWMDFDDLSLVREFPLETIRGHANYLALPELIAALESTAVEKDCPQGYVLVPGNPLYGTPAMGQDFCVMKYAASKSNDGSEKAASVIKALPWVEINRDEAEMACRRNGAQYHLITNAEWMAIARNIEATPQNWHRGADPAGIERLPRGNSDSKGPSMPSEDDYPYLGTQYSGGWTHKRTHVLSNDEVTWDLAGNVWQWVADPIKITENHPQDPRFPSQSQWIEFGNTRYRALNAGLHLQLGPVGNYDSTQNIGQINVSPYGSPVTARGGDWQASDHAGIFTANCSTFDLTSKQRNIGFRCAMELPEPESAESFTDQEAS